jgi:hypothetical protein
VVGSAAVRVPLGLLVLAVAVRAALVAAFPDPAYPDAAYYAAVARSIAGGDGLTVPFVWIFAELGDRIPAVGTLPIPSNGHWLPLASLLQAPFVTLLGPTAVANALSGVLVGALAAPLTWAIARDARVRPGVALAAGVLAAIPGPLFAFMGQPENFGLVHVLIPLSLWLAARGLAGSGAAFALAGLVAGLVALARTDGLFLALAIGLVWLLDRLRWRRSRGGSGGWARVEAARPLSLVAAVGSAMGFLAVMAPWWARQLATFGSISPTTSNGSALWIRSLAEWDSITARPSLERFLAQGPAAIAASRLAGLGSAVVIFATTVLGIVLVPFFLVGALLRRGDVAFRPWFAYATLLFAAAALLFPLHVPNGTWAHAIIGLAPHATILALDGVAAVAGRLPGGLGRDPRAVAAPVLLAAALVAGLGLATAPSVLAGWAAVRDPRIALAADLDARGVPATDRLLALDAAGTWYWTHRPTVVTPNDPIGTVEAVARAYGIRWLVVEPHEVVPAVRDAVATDAARPSWIGPAALVVDGADGTPALLLYPVCTTDDDARCAPAAPGTGAGG